MTTTFETTIHRLPPETAALALTRLFDRHSPMHSILGAFADLRTVARRMSRIGSDRRRGEQLEDTTIPLPSLPAVADPIHVATDAPHLTQAVAAPCHGSESFRLIPCAEVESHVRDRLERQFKDLPRPPRAFHEFLPFDFVARASSNYVADLVAGEPIVAARILAKVNSAFYGARTPILQIGQAITFLGLQSVRNICLRYLLDESFRTANPGTRAALDELGESSTIASELCHRFAKRMVLDDPSSLTTHVVLSFTGHLACALMLPADPGLATDSGSPTLLHRFERQQASIGLAAPEVGRLLLSSWSLPPSLVDKVAMIDRVAMPSDGTPTLQSQTRAIGFLCARLGERLARKQIGHSGQLEALPQIDRDLRFLRSHFDPLTYAEVVRTMIAPDFLQGFHVGVS